MNEPLSTDLQCGVCGVVYPLNAEHSCFHQAPSADVGVWVRAELVEKLREAIASGESINLIRLSRVHSAARALVDAVDRSAAGEGEAEMPGPNWDGSWMPPAVPVGEPLCRCGHPKSEHTVGMYRCMGCTCIVFRYGAPAPVPVSDEAEAAWDEWAKNDHNGRWMTCHIAFLAGFRAARGEEA